MASTIFYLPKKITLEAGLELYSEQERRKYPGRNPSHIDPSSTHFEKVATATKPLDVLLTSLPRGSRVVLWSIRDLGIPVARLRSILLNKKADFLTIRILDPEFLIDVSTPEGESFFHIIEAMQGKVDHLKSEAQPRKVLSAKLNPSGFGFAAVPQEVIAMLRQDKINGLTVRALSEKYGYSQATVSKYTKGIVAVKEEVEPRLREISPDDVIDYEKLALKFNVRGGRARSILVEYIKSQRTYSTKKIYSDDLARFFEWYEERTGKALAEIEQIDHKTGLDYRDYLKEVHSKVSVIRRYFINVRSFLSYCLKRGYVNINNFSTIKMPHENKREVKTDPFDKEELKRVVDVAAKQIEKANSYDVKMVRHRNFVAVWLLANAGLRISGLLSLKKKDVIVKGNDTILNVRDKGGEEYKTSLDDKSASIINKYLDTYYSRNDGNAYVIWADPVTKDKPLSNSAIYSALRKIFEKAGVSKDKKITSHSFRVTFTTLSSKAGVPTKVLQGKLNHKRIEQTEAYIKLAEEKKENSWMPQFELEEINATF